MSETSEIRQTNEYFRNHWMEKIDKSTHSYLPFFPDSLNLLKVEVVKGENYYGMEVVARFKGEKGEYDIDGECSDSNPGWIFLQNGGNGRSIEECMLKYFFEEALSPFQGRESHNVGVYEEWENKTQ